MTAKQKLHQSNLALWMARFNDQAASGLSLRVLCERNNLSYHAYNYWKHLAKESYVDAIMPDIVPIKYSGYLATNAHDIHPRNFEYFARIERITQYTPYSLYLLRRH